MVEDGEDIRWMSYTELAEARGIDRLSAIRIARRRRWTKQKGNDGTIRVAVPRTVLESKRHDPRDIPPDITRKIIGLESRVEVLGEQLTYERGRVHELTETVAELREQRAAAIATAEARQAEIDRLQAAQESRQRVERQEGQQTPSEGVQAVQVASPEPVAPLSRRFWRRFLRRP